MITLTLRELKSMEPSLGKLLTTDVKPRIAWKLRTLARIVKKELTELESKRLEIAVKYADPENPEKVAADKVEEFKAEYQVELDKTVELKSPEIVLDEIEGVKLSAIDIAAIEFLFSNPDPL